MDSKLMAPLGGGLLSGATLVKRVKISSASEKGKDFDSKLTGSLGGGLLSGQLFPAFQGKIQKGPRAAECCVAATCVSEVLSSLIDHNFT